MLALKILFVLAVAVEAIFTPLYLKALWPKKCLKSLCLKMVCSAMFFSIGVLSAAIAKNTSVYAVTILFCLGCGWIGDYFLHAKPDSKRYFAIGYTFFLIGHIVYITAFSRALLKLQSGTSFFGRNQVIAFAVLYALSILAGVLFKLKFNPRKAVAAVLLYAAVLCLMLIKALSLALCFYRVGAAAGAYGFAVLAVGSAFFFLSDASIAVIIFGGKNRSYPLKIFNIVTYFWGQVLLASSILFIAI